MGKFQTKLINDIAKRHKQYQEFKSCQTTATREIEVL